MKYFLIKGFKGASTDKFMMKGSEDYLLFVAYGLSDLENTIKGILPKGYRVRKKETLSRKLKQWGGVQMRSMFNVPMVEVKEIDFKPKSLKEIEYFNNSRNQTFKIKTGEKKYWEETPGVEYQ